LTPAQRRDSAPVGARVYHCRLEKPPARNYVRAVPDPNLPMTGFAEHKPLDLPQLDAEIRAWWEAEKVFEASTSHREGAPVFTF